MRWSREDLRVAPGVALYWMQGTRKRLLYIGITDNPVERWRAHSYRARWWAFVQEISYVVYPTRTLALAAERDAIRHERPEFNIRSAVT